MSKKFNQLYAKASTGRIKTWIIEADGNTMIIRNGLLGGKMKEQTKTIVGKNIGKANETTPEQQCELECQSKWQKKIDEQYSEDRNIASSEDYTDKEILLPMLAHTYEKRKHDIKFPCYVQPKLNGVRCIFQNSKFMSRGGKEYDTLEHLRPELEKLGVPVPDGEIYVHGMNFQQIVRLVKKFRSAEENGKLEYWIYDQVSDNDFDTRRIDSSTALAQTIQDSPHLKMVPTIPVNTEEEIKRYHDIWVKEGYEGVIIRNRAGGYDIKHRSKNLQKYKEFFDEEFEIKGFTQGSGIEEGCIVYVCTDGNATFNVRPRGSHEVRRELFKKGDELVGKQLTVRFQEKSEDGVPIFPVGITVRDYE